MAAPGNGARQPGLLEEFGWFSCLEDLLMLSTTWVANSQDYLPTLRIPIRC